MTRIIATAAPEVAASTVWIIHQGIAVTKLTDKRDILDATSSTGERARRIRSSQLHACGSGEEGAHSPS